MSPRTRLFDEFRRTDGSPSGHLEDSFAFMNRAAHGPWGSVRSLLEQWFATYPVEHANDLRGGFRSNAPQQHFAAWWELYLFRLFGGLGYAVEIHPSVEHTSRRPDFRLRGPAGSLFVEARLVHSGVEDDDHSRHAKREAAMLDLIDGGYDPNFHVGVTFERVGATQPTAREVVDPLLSWLHGLDPDRQEALLRAGHEPESLHLSARDWVITFDALPISSGHRGKQGQLIGLYPMEAGVINDREKLRGALQDKSGRYKQLGDPYLIAPLCMSASMSDEDVEQALFGSHAVQYRVNDPDFEPRWVRQRDGFWTRGGRPRAQGVSGVLVATSVFPWNLQQSLPRLWLNPWAARPFSGFDELPKSFANDGGILQHDPASVGLEALLALPEDWDERMRRERDG